jgi:hypothetical protein
VNIIKYLVAHWHDLLLLVVLLLGTLTAVLRKLKKTQESELLTVLDTLYTAALSFVTEAEKAFGVKTGVFKCADVIAKLYVLIPDKFKPLIGQEQLKAIVDKTLDEAKQKWESNQNIKSFIEQA